MKNKERVAIIVHCYGHFDKEIRLPAEMAGYQMYLEEVATAICRLAEQYEIRFIVVSGGPTDRGRKISEASTVMPVLQELVTKCGTHVPCQWIAEEEALNTPQNILKSAELVRDINRLILICDKVRAFKVRALASCIINNLCPRKVIGIPRPDIHPNSKWWKQVFAGLLYLVNRQRLITDLQVIPPSKPLFHVEGVGFHARLTGEWIISEDGHCVGRHKLESLGWTNLVEYVKTQPFHLIQALTRGNTLKRLVYDAEKGIIHISYK